MIKKLILSAVLGLVGTVVVMAQASDYKKSEVYVGYSNNQIDSGADSGNSVQSFFNDRESFNGFEAAGVYNVHRYFGIKGDVSGTYKNKSVNYNAGTANSIRFDINRSVYNFLGGVQVKNNSSDARVKPFAHALIGAGVARYKAKNLNCATTSFCISGDSSNTETGFAGAFGGGLDIKAGSKISVRAFQVDYNPIRIDGSTSHNVRFGAGIVF